MHDVLIYGFFFFFTKRFIQYKIILDSFPIRRIFVVYLFCRLEMVHTNNPHIKTQDTHATRFLSCLLASYIKTTKNYASYHCAHENIITVEKGIKNLDDEIWYNTNKSF